MTTSGPNGADGDVRDELPRLGLDCAIVFGLAFAASLYSFRAMEASRGEWGWAVTGQTTGNGLLTPSLDAVAAVRQWVFTRDEERRP